MPYSPSAIAALAAAVSGLVAGCLVDWSARRRYGLQQAPGARFSARSLFAGAALAVALAAIAFSHGPGLEAIELSGFAGILLYLSLADLHARVIPDGCILAAVAVRLLYLATAIASGSLSLSGAGFYLASAIGVGAVLAAAALLADRLLGGDSIGGGDLKLYAVAGLYLGWERSILVILLSCMAGLVAAAVFPSAAPEGSPGVLGRTFPLGPAIALSCVVVLVAGAVVLP